MSIKSVLSVDSDGTIRGLWTEDVPLESIGRLSMQRASHVEFNETTQLWEVWIAGKQTETPAFTSPSRQACIDWERNYFHDQFLNS